MARTPRSIGKFSVLALTILLLALGTSTTALAQTGSAPNEGIKVHGHWTIDVLNRDGSLAAHYEFQNALANHLGASTFLNGVLSRTKRMGLWSITLSGGQNFFYLAEPGFPDRDVASQTLSVTVPTSGTNAGKLVLSGSRSAPTAATIDGVQTVIEDCPLTGACPSDFGFTQKSLPSSIPIAEGQIVQVTVVISFS
jgi:hypothetical protein